MQSAIEAILGTSPIFLWTALNNRDLVKGKVPTATTNVTYVIAPDIGFGPRAAKFNGTDSVVTFADSADFSAAGSEQTVGVVCYGLTGTASCLFAKAAGGQYEWTLRASNNVIGGEVWQLDGGAVRYQQTTSTITNLNNGLVTAFMDRDEGTGNEASLVVNGARSNVASMTGDSTNGTGTLNIGLRGDGATGSPAGPWDGNIMAAFIWPRRLQLATMRYLDSVIRGG